MSQSYFDFDPDPAYYHPNSYRPEFHTQPEEEYQLPPLSEEEEAKHDAAWMRQIERMCCED